MRSNDPARAVLEALGWEAYRQRRITGYQLRILLGMATRWGLYDFLKEHKVETYTAEDFEHDLKTIRQAEQAQKAKQLAFSWWPTPARFTTSC